MSIGKRVRSRHTRRRTFAPDWEAPRTPWSDSNEPNHVAVHEPEEEDSQLSKEEHLAGLWDVLGLGD